MSRTCASCGAALTEAARFCSVCGAAVDASAAPAGAPRREERKVVTALFADIVGSTSLAERMDPEDFRDMVAEAMRRMASAVERFGGEVFEYRGDGILALLGAPVAHEDDPERAILAALEITESISSYSHDVAARWGVEGFAVRIGIETGLAVLGAVGGDAGKLAYGAVGDTLNTAARLQAEAEPGAVLVGPRTHRLTEALFEFGEPIALALKGKAEPVVARRVQRPHPAGARAGGVAAPLVGRDEELRRGVGLVDEVLAGSGRILFVSGEAGIGKSRLVAELRARFEGGESLGGQPRWFEGRCVSYGEALPYWPFRSLLRAWLGELAHEGESEALAAALERELERLAGDRGAELAEPLALVLATAVPGGGDAAEPPPQVMQERIHTAVSELFDRLAAEGPVALALDDLHWADASSLALIERLLELAERAPILLVLTSRPEREHEVWELRQRALRELAHRARELPLEPLAGERDRELLAALVGSADLPEELERRLLARAEGNPFYLEELVRSMVESGALRAAGEGGWTFDRDVPVELPGTVEKLILARIDRLSAPAQDLLGVAAVLGRQFPRALLEEIAGADAAAALPELQSAELVRDAARWPVPFLAFRHTLIQEAAYRGLLRRRRQELHAAAIEATERLYPDRLDEFAAIVAYHADAAGDDRRALDFHHRAGETAARVFSVAEAIEHFDAALAGANRLPGDGADPTARRARLARGTLELEVGELEPARSDFEAAMEAARGAADDEVYLDAAVGLVTYWRSRDFGRASEVIEQAVRASEGVAPLARVNVLARLAIQYVNQLRLDRALEVGERALSLAITEGDARSQDRAKDALKLVAQHLGEVERLDELARELLASLRNRPEDATLVPWVMLEAAFVPLARGEWDEAEHLLIEARDLVRARSARLQEPLLLDALGWVHRARGDFAQATQYGRAAAELGHRLRIEEWASWADASLGWTLLEAGEIAEAAAVLERGLRAAEAANPPAQVTRCVCLLACARSLLGDRAEARELAARGEELLGRVTAPPRSAWLYGGHAYCALARARLEAGDRDGADALAAPILEAAERTGWGPALAGAGLLGELAPPR